MKLSEPNTPEGARAYWFAPPSRHGPTRTAPVALVVDARELARQTMIEALRDLLPHVQFLEAASLAAPMTGAHACDVVIVAAEHVADVDSRDLQESLEAFARAHPRAALVVLLEDAVSPLSEQLSGDVAGLMLADGSIEILAAGLQIVLAGGSFGPVSPPRAGSASGQAAARDQVPDVAGASTADDELVDDGFTKREAEIVQLLLQGLQNKLIAFELQVSESTVKVHLRNIMKKLHASNRTQVAMRVNGARLLDGRPTMRLPEQ